MAGENLESSIIIHDEASKVLENIADQSEKAGDALAEIEKCINAIDAFGGVNISAGESIKEIEAALKEASIADSIDTSALDAANERARRSFEDFSLELEKDAQDMLADWEETGKYVESLPENVSKEIDEAEDAVREAMDKIDKAAKDMKDAADKTQKKSKSGLLDVGIKIWGWVQLAKDVIETLYRAFKVIAEKADEMNMRMARYGMVADAEGKTGSDRSARSDEIYEQQRKFAQALGVTSKGFNDTVLNMYSNGMGVVKSLEEAQTIAASSYMAMDLAGLQGRDKEAVMGEIQSMVSVGIADPDQIQEAMKIAPNILRTIEKQWQADQNGKAYKTGNGTEITDATGQIAVLAQEGQITADLVRRAMVNSAEETNKKWNQVPNTFEKLQNRVEVMFEDITKPFIEGFARVANSETLENLLLSIGGIGDAVMDLVGEIAGPLGDVLDGVGGIGTGVFDVLAGALNMVVGILKWIWRIIGGIAGKAAKLIGEVVSGIGGFVNKITTIIPYVLSNITNIGGVFKSMVRGIKSYFMQFVNWFMDKIASLLEFAGKVSDTAADAAREIRAEIETRKENLAEYDVESEKIKAEWMGAEYAEYSRKNKRRWTEGLQVKGFLDKVLENQKAVPGTKKNPAHVKGKVAIDGEWQDIMKRAAGAEIVNRYTTLRPVVNARFGDIHQMDAQDVLGGLVDEMERARGAAISDAQAQGAA